MEVAYVSESTAAILRANVIALAHILTGWGLVKRGAIGGGQGRPRQNFTARDFTPRTGGFFAPFFLRRWRQRNLDNPGRANGVMGQYGFFFDAGRHDFAAQTLLEQTIGGGGIEQGEQALDLLARSPATAKHLSFELAQYFVSDNPPPHWSPEMTNRYIAESDGNIREVLATIFASEEFWDSRNYNSKFKTPYEYVISAVRATDAPVVNVLPLAGTMAALGMPLYGCQTPDGYKNTREAWLNPDAMMLRLSFATGLGAGRLPLDRRPDDDSGGGLGALRKDGKVRPINFNGKLPAPNPEELAMTLGDQFSARTADAVESAPAPLRAPLILGSPEFMQR